MNTCSKINFIYAYQKYYGRRNRLYLHLVSGTQSVIVSLAAPWLSALLSAITSQGAVAEKIQESEQLEAGVETAW